MGEPLDDARRLLADGTWIALRPVRGDGDPWRIRYTSGPLVRYALRALADEAERLQARIADLEAELSKPVAGVWRDTDHGQWRLDMGGFWALKWNTDGWSVWTENHTRMAHGPETGPEAERLADLAAANKRADEAEASARFQAGMTDATQRKLCDAQRDLAAARERAEKAEQARDNAHHHIQLHLDALPPDILEERRRCAGAKLAAAKAREERDAALERARMALWALALERMDPRAAPAGWDPWDGETWGWEDAPDDQRVTVERMTRDTGPEPRPMMWVVYVDSYARHRGDAAAAAILSIDPTAKPPEGWTP